MDENIKKSVYEILETMDEALEFLKHTENEECRELMSWGREKVTKALEKSMECSLDERIDISHLSDEDWLRTAYHIMKELSDPFQPVNLYDNAFLQLLDFIWKHTKQEMLNAMLLAVRKLPKDAVSQWSSYFSKYPFWGSLDLKKGDYTVLERRVDVLKQHSYDFLWLYCRMEDYLSKYTLYAILLNWAILDMDIFPEIKSAFPDYWDPDIFPDNHDDVLVDVGAFNGDSILQYVQTYGSGYRKIYAYEISENSYNDLCRNVKAQKLHDVIARRKGAGSVGGEMFIESNETNHSANRVSRSEDSGQQVEIVPLDEDVEDTITFLKMDIEGAEQDALLGCEQTIRDHHPKLAICTYHGYEDIWKIPVMIEQMYSGYRFYMRYYGGNAIPTEFVLLCKP